MEVIKYPLSTEKSIRMMESENKLAFVVDRRATKAQVKEAITNTFDVKVVNIKTLITTSGNKKAIVKLDPETPAIDVATQLGIM